MTVTIRAPPTQARFASAYFLPWGCSCPRLTSRGLGTAKEHPSYAHVTSRREALFAACRAYNQLHPRSPSASQARHECWRSCSP